jgi:hypothetical protein
MSQVSLVGRMESPKHLPSVTHEPVRRPAKIAGMLALAYHIQKAIDDNPHLHRAFVAKELGFTRARITQLLDLLLLSPDIQEAVADLEAIDGVEPMSERALRELARMALWSDQRRAWRALQNR